MKLMPEPCQNIRYPAVMMEIIMATFMNDTPANQIIDLLNKLKKSLRELTVMVNSAKVLLHIYFGYSINWEEMQAKWLYQLAFKGKSLKGIQYQGTDFHHSMRATIVVLEIEDIANFQDIPTYSIFSPT